MFWEIATYFLLLSTTLFSSPGQPNLGTGSTQPGAQSNASAPAPSHNPQAACRAPSGRRPGCNHNETLVSDTE